MCPIKECHDEGAQAEHGCGRQDKSSEGHSSPDPLTAPAAAAPKAAASAARMAASIMALVLADPGQLQAQTCVARATTC
jgi:hypothetical protein